jgi:hypothetical protein
MNLESMPFGRQVGVFAMTSLSQKLPMIVQMMKKGTTRNQTAIRQSFETPFQLEFSFPSPAISEPACLT